MNLEQGNEKFQRKQKPLERAENSMINLVGEMDQKSLTAKIADLTQNVEILKKFY